jgi:anion transporter
MARINLLDSLHPMTWPLDWRLALKVTVALVIFLALLLAPMPESLSRQGQIALAIMALAVVLWITEVIPIAVTGLVCMLLLALLGAVPGIGSALYGFSQPVAYFLLGILTLGLAVQRSGLAERMAIYLIRGAGGSPGMLYAQMLFSFAALTFALPSASTRGAIMVHVYEQVMQRWNVLRTHPFNQAVMLAMGSLNRLGSTALLAGGITPVVASGLLGDFSWTRWFMLMSVPFYATLVLGGVIVFLQHRAGFRIEDLRDLSGITPGEIKPAEIKMAVITLATALLWFTDFAHGLHPAVPALIALAVILMPGIGMLSWREFESNTGWSNFFVIATSLSLANGLVSSGAAAWFSATLVSGLGALTGQPLLTLFTLAISFALVRLVVPNIAGYLALVIPVAMATAGALGINPLVAGMAVVVVGDSLVYYPAAGNSGVFIYQRAEIGAPIVFRFALAMTVVAIGVLFAVAVPYWGLVGQPLVR